MEHSVREEGKTVIVGVSGDIDLESSPEARRVLLAEVDKGSPVLVDMSGVSYIDSSGVASLVESLQMARAKGGDFALAAVSESALRVLQLARLDKVFAIHDTIEDGLADGG